VSTEAGILEMDERMKSGRLKVAAHLSEWFEEYRFYHRKDGQIVKIKDDLMSRHAHRVMMKRFGRAGLGSKTHRFPQPPTVDRRRHRLRRLHRRLTRHEMLPWCVALATPGVSSLDWRREMPPSRRFLGRQHAKPDARPIRSRQPISASATCSASRSRARPRKQRKKRMAKLQQKQCSARPVRWR
jgi:hypothetical protein